MSNGSDQSRIRRLAIAVAALAVAGVIPATLMLPMMGYGGGPLWVWLWGWVFYGFFFAALAGLLAGLPAAVLWRWSRGDWPLPLILAMAVVVSLIALEPVAALCEWQSKSASDPAFYGGEWFVLLGGISLVWGVAIGTVQWVLARAEGPAVRTATAVLLSVVAAPAAAATDFAAMALILLQQQGTGAREFFQLEYALAIPAGIVVGSILPLTHAAAARGIRSVLVGRYRES